MLINQKLKTCSIVSLILIQSFLFFIISPTSVNAEDPWEDLDLSQILLLPELMGLDYSNILTPHPYRFVGAYYAEESMEISGDVKFNLYFSSPYITQLDIAKYQDKVNVSMYYIDSDSTLDTLTATKIENANISITLKPESSDELAQKVTFIISDVEVTIDEGDYLLISIEIEQSKKIIPQFIENYYPKIKNWIERGLNLLNSTSKDENISETVELIKQLIDLTGGTEFADIVNSQLSSSFYYGSKNYNSSIVLPSKSDNNITLFFHNYPNFELDTGEGYIQTINRTAPTSSVDNSYPPKILSSGESSEEQAGSIESWVYNWLLYILSQMGYESFEGKIVTYYLSDDHKLKTDEPTDTKPIRDNLLKTPTEWTGIELERNMIISNLTAELYLQYSKFFFLRKITIDVTLFDFTSNTTIASKQIKIGRSNLIELLFRAPNSAEEIYFDDAVGKEIWNNHDIRLQISATGTPLLSIFKKPFIVYNSVLYPSSITLKLKETDNINITDGLGEKDIIPGGSAKFDLKVHSEWDDTLNIEVSPKSFSDDGDSSKWAIDYPKTQKVSKDSDVLIPVYVNTTFSSKEDYGKYVELYFNITGKTGIDKGESKVLISEYAVNIDFELLPMSGIEIKHGEKGKYILKIKNLNNGFYPDTYEIDVTSEHNWNLSYVKEIYDAEPYDASKTEYQVNITVKVPSYTDISSDLLKIKVTSVSARNLHKIDKIKYINVSTTIINPNILENFYHFFENLAKDIGLEDVLGSYAGAALLLLIILFIFFILIIVVIIIKKKYIELICLDRIKEITPDEVTTFDIKVNNPSNKAITYDIKTDYESKGFIVTLNKNTVVVDPKQTTPLVLTVKPTELIKANEWVEIIVSANVVGTNKTDKISLVVSIKEGKPDIKITGVLHWPRFFKQGERVETSFKLENRGNTSTGKVTVILYVNGEEKNRVEDVVIPSGGYADIEMPWIAVEGKNEVNIVVK